MCGFCDGIADMFRYDIFGSDVGRFIFAYIGDYLATCPANSPQESSHETEESAQEIAFAEGRAETNRWGRSPAQREDQDKPD